MYRIWTSPGFSDGLCALNSLNQHNNQGAKNLGMDKTTKRDMWRNRVYLYSHFQDGIDEHKFGYQQARRNYTRN